MARRIPQETLEEIKARTDLADLISSYGISVRRAGNNYKCCCPFHHEKTPSCHIQPDKGLYHCFGCGESGDAFKFVQKQEGLTFFEAAQKLARLCGVTIEEREPDPQAGLRTRLYTLLAELAAFYHRCLLKAKEAEPARQYLASRHLPSEVVEQFCIGYAPQGVAPILTWAEKYHFTIEELRAAGVLAQPRMPGDRPYHPFGGRLMFTVCDRQGRPVAFSGRILDAAKSPRKYVNSPETPVFKKSRILFALDKAAANIVKTPGREAIVCEGQIDVIRCHACGFGNAVASQGTAFTADHVRLLQKCADSVVLVFDADGAGQKAAIRSGGEFLAAGMPVRVATLPPGEDPDSLLRDRGADTFRACLDASESVTHFQVRTLLAKEEHPNSIDAVARVGRAVLATLKDCPSALIRASLMAEAAQMLGVPVAALEEDLARLPVKGAAGVSAPVPSLRPPSSVSAPSPRPSPASAFAPTEDDEPPGDLFDDDRPFEASPPAELDAASPENNPPSPRETAFCEFLFTCDRPDELMPLMDAYAPDVIWGHDFTCQFVAAWKRQAQTGLDEITALRTVFSPAACRWLDGILLSNDPAASSELTPVRILQDYLRLFWMEAYRRRQGLLPSDSTPENDSRRLAFSTAIRRLQRSPWETAATLMTAESLA